MKYFTATVNEKEIILGSAGATKRYLKNHPDIKRVTRYWWSRDDLIDCEEYTRDKILGRPVGEIERGQTAQWAAQHGRW